MPPLKITFFDDAPSNRAVATATPRRRASREETPAEHWARLKVEMEISRSRVLARRAAERRADRAIAERDAELDYAFPRPGECAQRLSRQCIEADRERHAAEMDRLRSQAGLPEPETDTPRERERRLLECQTRRR